MRHFVEACCTSVEAVREACLLGFGRIELCEDLLVGGVTPSEELIRETMALSTVPVNVLVRPRGGDFVYNEAEIRQMVGDIVKCRALGVNGIVIGALDTDGHVDLASMRRLIEAAGGALPRPLEVTFHKAFDECADPFGALEEIAALGCGRVLTSGQAGTALEGSALIGALVRRSPARLTIMVGGSVRPSNIDTIQAATFATEFHTSFLSSDY